jgi:hypothetical protein
MKEDYDELMAPSNRPPLQATVKAPEPLSEVGPPARFTIAREAKAREADEHHRPGLVAPALSKPTPGHLLDQDYLTSTGETVPWPGASQSAGSTPLDRAIQQQDNKIDNSICTSC